MILYRFGGVCLALCLIMTLPNAGRAADLKSGIVGAVIGGVIVNEVHKNKAKKKEGAQGAQVAVSGKSERRSIQSALNYFGFPAGTPDGVMGPKSRNAAAQYQSHLGHPATGLLTRDETAHLLDSHQKALAEGDTTRSVLAQPVATSSGANPTPSNSTSTPILSTTASSGGPAQAGVSTEAMLAMLPAVSQQRLREMEGECASSDQALRAPGFVQMADLNSDGQLDVLVDTSAANCPFWCGAQNCAVTLFGSDGAGGYRANEMLGYSTTPTAFQCDAGGICTYRTAAGELAGAANPVATLAVVQPVSTATLPTAEGQGLATLRNVLLSFDGWEESINNIGPNFFVTLGNIGATPLLNVRWVLYGGHTPDTLELIAASTDAPFFLDDGAHRMFHERGVYRQDVTLCTEHQLPGQAEWIYQLVVLGGEPDAGSPKGKWFNYHRLEPARSSVSTTAHPCGAI